VVTPDSSPKIDSTSEIPDADDLDHLTNPRVLRRITNANRIANDPTLPAEKRRLAMYSLGNVALNQKMRVIAKGWFKKACDLGHPRSCDMLKQMETLQ